MSFTVDSNHIKLFNGDFYAQVKVSATKDLAKKEYTVKVEGIRAYSKYEWNFGQRVTAWLGTDKSGSEKVKCPSSGYVSVASSGSNKYRGWIPQSEYSSKLSFSKTYKAKSDGTCPPVYLFFEDYNPDVLYVSAGVHVSPYVSYTGDISSSVQKDANGPFDMTEPTINTFVLKPTSTTTATLELKTDYACSFVVYNSKSEEVTKGTTTGGVILTKSVTVNSESGTYTVTVKRTDDNTLQANGTTTCDTSGISIESLSVTPVNSTTVQITVKATQSYNWEYKLPGTTAWKAGKTNIAKGTPSSLNVTANALDGTYNIRVIRTSCSGIVASASYSCCNVPPSITEFSLTPNSGATAEFILKTDCKCTYVLSSPSGSITTGTVNTSLSVKNQSVNHSKRWDYTVKVTRADGKNEFYVSKTLSNIDTRVPVLSITDVVPEGNQIKFKASATMDGSSCTCHSWRATLHNSNKSSIYTDVVVNSGDATSINYTLRDCKVGEPLILSVEAKRKSNSAWASIDYASPIVCTGFADLYDGSKHRKVLCYIYDGSKWNVAVPYVYDGNKWRICD